jgi:hypothetical protein
MVGGFILFTNRWSDNDVCFPSFPDEKIRKRGAVNGILTVILPFIFMATVNYGKDPEIETEEEEEESKRKKLSWVR